MAGARGEIRCRLCVCEWYRWERAPRRPNSPAPGARRGSGIARPARTAAAASPGGAVIAASGRESWYLAHPEAFNRIFRPYEGCVRAWHTSAQLSFLHKAGSIVFPFQLHQFQQLLICIASVFTRHGKEGEYTQPFRGQNAFIFTLFYFTKCPYRLLRILIPLCKLRILDFN